MKTSRYYNIISTTKEIFAYIVIDYVQDYSLKLVRLYQKDKYMSPLFDAFTMEMPDEDIVKKMLKAIDYSEKFYIETSPVF